MQHVEAVVRTLVWEKARQAVKYVSPKEIVRATRRLQRGRVPCGNIDIVLTIGRPNYKDRQFIKKCQKVGEPFPVKKIQLRYPPASWSGKAVRRNGKRKRAG